MCYQPQDADLQDIINELSNFQPWLNVMFTLVDLPLDACFQGILAPTPRGQIKRVDGLIYID